MSFPGSEPPYPPHPGQPGYGAQPSYPAQPHYPAQPGYAIQPAYPAQPGYPTPVFVAGALAPPTSGLATASLILGIVGLLTCGTLSLFAVITGHLALPQTRNGQYSGHGQAVAGLVMGYLALIPLVLGVVMYILFLVGILATIPFAGASSL